MQDPRNVEPESTYCLHHYKTFWLLVIAAIFCLDIISCAFVFKFSHFAKDTVSDVAPERTSHFLYYTELHANGRLRYRVIHFHML